MAYHYDPEQALEELEEEGRLPNVVQLRDILARRAMSSEDLVAATRLLHRYQDAFSEAMSVARDCLQLLIDRGERKT